MPYLWCCLKMTFLKGLGEANSVPSHYANCVYLVFCGEIFRKFVFVQNVEFWRSFAHSRVLPSFSLNCFLEEIALLDAMKVRTSKTMKAPVSSGLLLGYDD